MDIETKKRHRGETMRPAILIRRDLWKLFCFKYPLNKQRNEILESLLCEQLESEIVVAPQINFKLE